MSIIQTKDITISFDFDDTLSNVEVQKIARGLVKDKYNVIITTSRGGEKDNSDLEDVAEALGINSVKYTNYEDKHIHLKGKGVDIHVDNDRVELFLLQQYTNIVPVDVKNKDWIFMLNELLDR